MSNGYYNDDSTLCCRRICGFVTGICIIIAVVLIIVYFVIKPKPPLIYVSSVTVPDLKLGKDLHTVSGNFKVDLNVINQDKKMTAFFGFFKTAVFYKSSRLGVPAPGELTLPKSSSAKFTQYVNVNGASMDPVIPLPNGNVNFNFRVLTDVVFKGGFAKPRYYHVKAICDDVPIQVSSGTLVGDSKRCIVMLS